MVERRKICMMEEGVRLRLKSILGKLRKARSLGEETKVANDSGSVDYHIEHILKGGGGVWNELFAEDYIKGLEAEVSRETKIYRHPVYINL